MKHRTELSAPEQPTLYLASSSPRRREILRWLGLDFRIRSPKFTEPAVTCHMRPRLLALNNARGKALSILDSVPAGLIIGVDTIVALGNRILGKPADARDAAEMLQFLSGRTHRVISAVVVVRKEDGRIFSGTETTAVTFRRLPPRDIASYCRTGEPLDKAGAYAIQGRAGVFVRQIRGCYLNVVGLPLTLLLKLLNRAGAQY